MHWQRRISLALLAVCIIGSIVWGFMPEPVAVDVMAVERRPLQVLVEEEGYARVIDRYQVSAPVAGYVQRIELDVGDAVAAGQQLAVLQPLPSSVLDPRSRAQAQTQVSAAEATLHVAEENVAAAQAANDLARLKVERVKALCEVQCASEAEQDQAEADARRAFAGLRSAQFAVDVARHELESARTALRFSAAEGTAAAEAEALPEQVVLSSPISGRVLKVLRKSEGVVAAGQALLEVGDPRALEVKVDVLSADAVRIKPGTRVLFTRWGGDHDLLGVVRRVEPVGFTKISALGVEEQRVTVIADITSAPEQWQRLGDGYRVEAKFIIWEQDDVLQIPANSLFRYQDGWAVFVLQGERAVRRPLGIGQRNGLSAQVQAGLHEGDRVITHPDDNLEDGTRVYLRQGQ